MKNKILTLLIFLGIVNVFCSCKKTVPVIDPVIDPVVDSVTKPNPVIKLEPDYIDVPYSGGEFSLKYSIENPVEGKILQVENNTGWVEVLEVTYEKVKFRIDKNISSASREDKIILKYDTVLQEVPIIQQAVPNAPMIFKVQCAESGGVVLPLWGNVDCFIDWGDGTIEEYHRIDGISTGIISHGYNPNQAKIYKVSVFGKVSALQSYNPWTQRHLPMKSIIEVEDWGELGLVSMEYAFYDQPLEKVAKPRAKSFEDVTNANYAFYNTPLKVIPKGFLNFPIIHGFTGLFSACPLSTLPLDLFAYCPKALGFDECFRNCRHLESIPENLFAKCPDACSFISTFAGCESLTSIPEDLFSHSYSPRDVSHCFSGCKSLTSIPENLFNFQGCYIGDATWGFEPIDYVPIGLFSGVFAGCTSLTSIPENLFSKCVNMWDFSYAFSGCTSLTSIPANLFVNNENVRDFTCAFSGCTSLTSIPVNLFDNNRKVEKFISTFYKCANLTGESPYTVIDGVKYHLYERENNPEQFAKPDGHQCFYHCSNISDFDQMPYHWKYY